MAISPMGTVMQRIATPMHFFQISSFRNKSERPLTCSRLRFIACTGYHIIEKHIIERRVAANAHCSFSSTIIIGWATAANPIMSGNTINADRRRNRR